MDSDQYQLGKTKIFIKAPESVCMLFWGLLSFMTFYENEFDMSIFSYFCWKRCGKENTTDMLE